MGLSWCTIQSYTLGHTDGPAKKLCRSSGFGVLMVSSNAYVQAFIASEEVEGANSRLWLKAASFAPSWNLIDGRHAVCFLALRASMASRPRMLAESRAA